MFADVLWWIFGCFVVVHLGCCLYSANFFRCITKPLLMPLLLAAVLCSWDISIGAVRFAVIAALIAGAAGDYFLLRPRDMSHFIMGLLCFLIGHFSWIYIYVRFFTCSIFSAAGLCVVLALYAGYLLFSWFILDKRKDYVGVAIICYTAVLEFLHFISLGILINSISLFSVLFFTGTSLFLLSDSILALSIFRKKLLDWLPVHDFWIMLTYIGAQLCLSLGVCLYL